MSGSSLSAGTLSTRAGLWAGIGVGGLVVVAVAATLGARSILLLLLSLATVVAAALALHLQRDLRDRERALERSEDRYRTLFDRNVVGAVLADDEGRCIEANRSFARMLGIEDRRELEGEPLARWLGSDLPPPGIVREATVERADEKLARLVFCWGELEELEGPEGMLLSAVDVTEEHRARARLKAVLQAVDEGVITVDRAGRIQFANPAARRLLDLDTGDIGEVGAFGPHWELATLKGERLEPHQAPASRVLREGVPIEGEKLVLRRPGGAASIFRVSAAPLEGFPPLESEVVVTLSDVTGEVEANRILEESERLHRSVVNHVGQVLFQTDRERRITFLNPAWEELTGERTEEALGTDLVEHFAAEDRDRCRAELEGLLAGGRRYCHHEGRVRTRHGRERWVEVRARPATRGEDVRGGIVGLLNDITERRDVEERVARSRRMEAMGQLAGGVAHDFNNLLTVIVGYAQLIQGDVDQDPHVSPSVRENAREILRTSRKAAAITRQLLTFSRQQVLERVVLDPNHVIRSYEGFLRRILPASIACRIELDPALELVEISPTHLEQALLNLVLNARDALAHEPHGRVTVRTRNEIVRDPERAASLEIDPGRYVVIEVSDTGHGMDEATVERIFEPFFSTKEREKGSGLGLSAVYGIVQQAGGAVDVQSAPGEGSTFAVYLPAVPSAD